MEEVESLVNDTENTKQDKLFLVLNDKNYTEMRTIISDISDLNAIRGDGYNILIKAIKNQDVEAVKILLENDFIDPNFKY